jgi:hypothetical protein
VDKFKKALSLTAGIAKQESDGNFRNYRAVFILSWLFGAVWRAVMARTRGAALDAGFIDSMNALSWRPRAELVVEKCR